MDTKVPIITLNSPTDCSACGDPKCNPSNCSTRNRTSSSVEIRHPYERLRHYLTRESGGRRKLPRRENPNLQAYHPSLVKIEARNRRQLIATRDIMEGEVILCETPLMAAPSSKEFPIRKAPGAGYEKGRNGKDFSSKFSCICLGCYKNVTTLYKCSKCGWPVCSAECEKIPDHADFECEVFANNPVSPIVHSNEYKKIKILRCLLLREKYPARWNKILDLDAHDDLRKGNLCAVSTTIALFKFVQQECHLKQFDGETINHVVGVNTVNSFNTCNPRPYPVSDKTNNELRKASLLFYNASLLTHDCKPNTRSVISETENSFCITVMASSTIRKGQVLTHCYVDITRGTLQRRQELYNDYYFSCKCRRCLDPTEYCTFFSALKCPNVKCSGHLLPSNPLSIENDTVWYCNNIPQCTVVSRTEQVLELLRDVHKSLEDAAVEHSQFQEYENLQKVLSKYKNKLLHPNHFLVMDIQYAIITCINKLLELVNEEEAIRLSMEQVELCRSCIEVVDVLRPGYNRLRGNLLFFLHEGMLMNFLDEVKRNMSHPDTNFSVLGRSRFEEILKIMKIGREILVVEPVGSQEYIRAQKLSLGSSGLQPLMKYFNVTNDYN